MKEENRYICFHLGTEEFAIPLLSVREVVAIPEITPVPQTPSYFLGIMNLRGQVISVIDLRIKLGIKSVKTQESAIIICDLENQSIGIVVDSINYVVTIEKSELSEKPDISSSKNSDFISGVFKNKEKLILLLEIQKSLSISDQKMVQKNSQEKTSHAA